jgi:hypothetical protein
LTVNQMAYLARAFRRPSRLFHDKEPGQRRHNDIAGKPH